MSEHIETDATDELLSDEDQRDLSQLYNEPEVPEFHPVLEVWREVLKPIATSRLEPVSPQWANRICGAYREINYADMVRYRENYFDKLEDIAGILAEEIATDPDCLTYRDPAEDAKENALHYKNLLLCWQQAILQWELDWDTEDPDAAIEAAAISEVHKLVLGEQGICAYLDTIGFEYTEADQNLLAEALNEQREHMVRVRTGTEEG